MKNRYLKLIADILRQNWKDVFAYLILFALGAVLGLLPAGLMKCLINDALLKKNFQLLILVVVGLLVAYGSRSLCTMFSSHIGAGIGNKVSARLKSEVIQQAFQMQPGTLSQYSSGYLNARIEEAGKVETLFSPQILGLAASATEALCAGILLMNIDCFMTGLLLIPIFAVLLIVVAANKKLTQRIDKNLESQADYSGKLNESLRDIPSTRATGITKDRIRVLEEEKDRNLESNLRLNRAMNIYTCVMGLVGYSLSILSYFFCGIFVVNGTLSVGGFMSATMYAGKFYTPFLQLSGTYILLAPATQALKRLQSFFEDHPSVESADHLHVVDNLDTIEMKNLDIGYDGRVILKDFQAVFNVRSGDRIQLCGRNGSGKTSLVKAIFKELLPAEGLVLINGEDIRTVSQESITQLISYAPQSPLLFDASVRDNILAGKKDISSTDLDTLILKFGLKETENRLQKEGSGTIGESGKRLSGGEGQKISIIRALAEPKPLVILDEVTGNLDTVSIQALLDIVKNSSSAWIIIDHQHDLTKYGFRQITL